MTAEDNVEELIKQFTLAQGELLKGNSEPAKEKRLTRLASPLPVP